MLGLRSNPSHFSPVTLPFDSRTTGATLALTVGACLTCSAICAEEAEPVSSAPKVAEVKANEGRGRKAGKTKFTSEERAQLRAALSTVLSDPEVIASRNRARSAMETYKAELREAVKRASPELGEKVEKMLMERLAKSEKSLFLIRSRSFFKPLREIPRPLRNRARKLFAELSLDPTMEKLKKASIKTQDVPGRSKIYGAMRARIAEIIEKNDPALFEVLEPLPGAVSNSGDTRDTKE